MKIPIQTVTAKPLAQLEETNVLMPDANILVQRNSDGKSFKMNTEAFSQILNNFARPIAPSDTPPSTANRWYKPTTSSATPGTNYPNAGNLKAKNGFDTLFFFDGTNWIATEVMLPDSKINNWSAQSYDTGRQVYHKGSIYESNQSTLSSDIPDLSTKWTLKIKGLQFVNLVNPESFGVVTTNNDYNTPANYYLGLNKTFSTEKILTDLEFYSNINSTVNITICTVNGNSLSEVSSKIVPVVSGINKLTDLNINVPAGKYVFIKYPSFKMKYKNADNNSILLAYNGSTLEHAVTVDLYLKATVKDIEITYDLDDHVNDLIDNKTLGLVDAEFQNYENTSETVGANVEYNGYAVSPSTTSYPFINDIFVNKSGGSIRKIRIKTQNGGSLTLSVVNFSNNTYSIKQRFNITASPGIHEEDVNIKCEIGDTIGVDFNGSAGINYADMPSSTVNYLGITGTFLKHPGFLAINFDVQYNYTVESVTTTLNDLKDQKQVTTSLNQRITLEGQSNALGVGFTAGLSNSPFNSALFDWSKEFSRVFIWNPKTDNYENLKIGVNNMASWDAAYLHPAGSPTASSFGPEVGIALMWLQNNRRGNLYIDKNVGDGRPISYFQLGTPYYTEKLLRKSKADLWLSQRNISVSEIGFIWVQGESDQSSSKANYLLALNSLISTRIEDRFIKAETMIVIAQINPYSAAYGVGVADAKNEYAALNNMARIVNYANLYNPDNTHLNTAGQIQLGLQASEKILITERYNFENIETKINWTK